MTTYGTGYITRERGRFRLRVPDGKGGHRSAGTYDTRDEAERMRDAIAVERAERINATTLGQYGELAIERMGLRSIKSARSRWRIVQRAPFADDAIETLTRAEVRDWARSLPAQLSGRGTPLSWQSQKHALNLLRRVLDEAVEDGYRDDNPARGVKLGRREDTDENWTWLSLSEIEAVLALPLSLEQRTVITLAVYQGMRLGEIAALRWDRVDLDGGWLVVAASWGTATKSGRVRRIPLLQPAADALRKWQSFVHDGGERLPSSDLIEYGDGTQPRVASGVEGPAVLPIERDGGRARRPEKGQRPGQARESTGHRALVFPSPSGRVYSRGYDWGWGDRRAGRHDIPTRAGIGRRVRFHDLRHTCASHLVSGSWGRAWSLREVGELLGHTSEEVTRRYGHLAPDALHAAARETAKQHTANPPQDPPSDVRQAAAQLLAFIEESRQRAVGDSNPRPLAPEAERSLGDSSHLHSTDAPRGGFTAAELIAAVAAGRPVPQEALDELALGALSHPRALAALRALAGGTGAVGAALELAVVGAEASQGASEGQEGSG